MFTKICFDLCDFMERMFCGCVCVIVKCIVLNKLRLDHIVLDAAIDHNPLKLACYMDEDAVGQIKRLAAASNPRQTGLVVLQRYASYVCCRWLRQLTS